MSGIILAEIVCLSPMFCIFLLGGGYIWREATRKMSCRQCRMELPGPPQSYPVKVD